MVPGVGSDLRVTIHVVDRSGEVLWSQGSDSVPGQPRFFPITYSRPEVDDTSPRPLLLDSQVVPIDVNDAFADLSGKLLAFGGTIAPSFPGDGE